MRSLVIASCAWSSIVAVGLGCPKPGAVADAVRPKPSVSVPGEARCGASRGYAEPLVVEWPSSTRAKLEALAKKGLVAVRWEGCELEVLARCRAPGAYAWTPITRKDDHVSMRDHDELWANVPLGAGGLEGKLARSGALHVNMTIVGRWEADRDLVRADELAGECDGVTHVVTAMAAGAFDFWAGSEASVAGGASVATVGAGGKTASSAELLNRDGDVASCGKAAAADRAPPEGCGALLRLELGKVGAARPKDPPQCTGKTAWDGKQCAALVVGNGLECPTGFVAAGNECKKVGAAPVSATCTYGDPVECTKACEVAGEAASCNDLALMLSRGEGLGVDDKKATTFFLRACDLGSTSACNTAGSRLEYGRGAPKDEKTASTLYEKACVAGLASACNNLGRLVANGWGVERDEVRAAELFRKGCDQGDVGACANLGWAYVRGRGVGKDRPAGVAWLKKACTGGNGWACDRLKDLEHML